MGYHRVGYQGLFRNTKARRYESTPILLRTGSTHSASPPNQTGRMSSAATSERCGLLENHEMLGSATRRSRGSGRRGRSSRTPSLTFVNRTISRAVKYKEARQRSGQSVQPFTTYLETLKADMPLYSGEHQVQHLLMKLRLDVQAKVLMYPELP